MKTFTANEYMAHTLFIQRTERTPCRLPLVLQGILKSPHCFTLLIHSTCLERQRTQAVDSLESPVTKVLVCRGFFQKWGAQLYQNLPLVFSTFLKLLLKILWCLIFSISFNFSWLFLVNYLKKVLYQVSFSIHKRVP